MFEQPWNTRFIDSQCYPNQTSKQTRHIKWEKHTRCNPKRSENYLRSCWTCRVREILKIIGLEFIILAEGSYTVYQFLSKPLTLPLRNPINFQERFDARWSVEKPKCFMINSTNYCFLKRFLSVTSVSWWRTFSRSRCNFVRVDQLRAWNKFEFATGSLHRPQTKRNVSFGFRYTCVWQCPREFCSSQSYRAGNPESVIILSLALRAWCIMTPKKKNKTLVLQC